MNAYLKGTLMVLATAGIVYAGSARAEPAKEGELFTGAGVLCDTDEQVMSLFDAAQDKSGEKLFEMYSKLKAQRNERNEPSCVIAHISGATITKVTHLGDGYNQDGLKLDSWMVDVTKESIAGVVLFGEVAKAEPSKS